MTCVNYRKNTNQVILCDAMIAKPLDHIRVTNPKKLKKISILQTIESQLSHGDENTYTCTHTCIQYMYLRSRSNVMTYNHRHRHDDNFILTVMAYSHKMQPNMNSSDKLFSMLTTTENSKVLIDLQKGVCSSANVMQNYSTHQKCKTYSRGERGAHLGY